MTDQTLGAITPTIEAATEAIKRGFDMGGAAYALDELRSLPVEQRMEAMGMVPMVQGHDVAVWLDSGERVWKEI